MWQCEYQKWPRRAQTRHLTFSSGVVSKTFAHNSHAKQTEHICAFCVPKRGWRQCAKRWLKTSVCFWVWRWWLWVPDCSRIRWPCLPEKMNNSLQKWIITRNQILGLRAYGKLRQQWNILTVSQLNNLSGASLQELQHRAFSRGGQHRGPKSSTNLLPESLMKQQQIWHKITQECSKTWHSTYQVCSTVAAILAMVPYQRGNA